MEDFVDNEVSVVVVETTHHSADIAFANKDLVGRIAHIELGTWNLDDLKQIPLQGLQPFGITMPERSLQLLSEEAVGMPIIIQQSCLQMLLLNDVNELPIATDINLTASTVYDALHQVATERYGGFRIAWDRLCRGPRKGARKYNTYELILWTFSLDPITFELAREDIEPRLRKLPTISPEQVPPPGSVSSMLNAVGSFQEKLGIQLLEWSPTSRRLYITEPSFLFYLRWKDKKQRRPRLPELMQEMLFSHLAIATFNAVKATSEIIKKSREESSDKNSDSD